MSSPYKLVCPHCQSKIRIRTSVGEHIFLRRAYLQCTNEACGFTAIGSFEITHEMSPSGTPNPSIQLPEAPIALRRKAMASRSDAAEEQDDLFDTEEMQQ